MLDPAEEIKIDSVSLDGLEEVFDLAGTPGTESGTQEDKAGTQKSDDPEQPGHDSIEATDIATYVSTADAAKFASVDSRTIRRWYEQKKIRGRLSKGKKLLVVQEDLLTACQGPELFTAGTPGTESGTQETAGTQKADDPGQPGQSVDISETPATVFFGFVDRIERLSRENGELKAQLDEQRRENENLKLLTDSQHKVSLWARFYFWMMGEKK